MAGSENGARDFYAEWLGVAEGDRPPTHYALLGLERVETDATLIEKEASERTRSVRKKSLKFPAEATKRISLSCSPFIASYSACE